MHRLLIVLVTVVATVAWSQSISVRLVRPAGGEVFRPGMSEDLVWDASAYPGVFPTWRFQFATSPSGPWTDLPGATAVKDSAARRGQFLGGFRVPAIPTTTGYVRMVLVKPDGSLDESVTSRNQQPFTIVQPQPIRIDSVLRTPITTRVQLSARKVYGLDGYVFVDDGGVLVIEPGTRIVGDTVGQNSALCVNRGGKIIAAGTRTRPIIMTSSAPPGQRASGDWGGLLICGRARTNHPGGQAALEGGIADANQVRGWFGGTDDDDSSGVVRYVRIEFAGIAAAPNSELNSLTMGGVGRRTIIEYVQCSYGNDDSFEWFGGTVNGRYLISTGCLDDDFDTDNGWSGRVQFAVAQRFRARADQSISQAFESDNDASGSFNRPLTSGVFSNVTVIGPLQDTSWTAGTGTTPNTYNSRFGAAAQIRRNSRQSIINSVFIGWPRGVEIAGSNTMAAAFGDSLLLRNNTFYGIKGTWLNFAGGTPPSGMTTSWIEQPQFNNIINRASPALAQLINPFATDVSFNPQPTEESPLALQGTTFLSTPLVDLSAFQQVSYRGAFAPFPAERWDLPWAEYDPVNADYTLSADDASNDVIPLSVEVLPNPVNDAAVIRYSLPEDDRVSLSVFDVQGREVVRYLTLHPHHASIYEVPISAQWLTSGTYFARLTTERNGTVTVPIVIVR
ncbi:MAG: T9SS type A sorting domain-containing protein [Bacteroidota bacterium]|nr:T9SS type A sorting domain-containing protein [Candidatus Kapabacteria bacterium]MCS7303047.1 T9SS type A sorting domain-containing protein [Candidatus Kapabacteria bacterium]MDW8074161.1 T9SS type A sorting domain-containing protein [Bacteroidota bacterium]MDW8271363.1 T9SS type A sorting domain-containing protein [Bacteroidota bacterium]